MNFLRLFSIAIGLLVIYTSNAQYGPNKTFKDQSKGKLSSLSIDHFKTPREIVGCNCTFSESKEKFNSKEFLFAAKDNSIGFIAVNKKLIKLNLISTGETFGPADHKNIYSNGTYKVTIDTRFKKSTSEEVWWNEGTITIESKNGGKATKKFVGACGC